MTAPASTDETRVPLRAPGDDVDITVTFHTPVTLNWWLYIQPPGGQWYQAGHGTDPSTVVLSSNARRIVRVRAGTRVYLLVLLMGARNDTAQGDVSFAQGGTQLGSPIALNCELGDDGAETIETRVLLV